MSTRNQAKFIEPVAGPWEKLSSRAIRVMLTRRDVSYAQLVEALARIGISESERSIEGKVHRGSFRHTFFLQVLKVSCSSYPEQWDHALQGEMEWEDRASALFRAELSLQPWLDWVKLSRRLEEIGVYAEPESLRVQVDDGSFSTALFLQCAAVCRFAGVHLFLDPLDLKEAALAGASPT
ncbi:hypothetical protein IAG25_38760 [Caballeronia sp. EK]|uniref:DUF6471 domain-containing protein n=1 Tax=Caballeronia sp. EK TaxID=2767469 RepID=UPI001654E0C5|nr:DUF6471 domain-containing protein [Caballeronia sp. EK]MBC8642744.1 hypothetical protein [Caballeronia sp. EK]